MRVLYIEPFDAGSHAAFTRTVTGSTIADWTVVTMPGRHWKWRMRGAALWIVERHAAALVKPHDVLLASSYTPLADLVALAPALTSLPRVLYFHENQWAYPVREERARDHHFGFTQMVSALAADLCLFNSRHNLDTFVAGCRDVLDRMPDLRPAQAIDRLLARCEVLPLPIDLAALGGVGELDPPPGTLRTAGPTIVWNHRWEHDKGPQTFFAVVGRLAARGVPFRLFVCGESFTAEPECFARAPRELHERIDHLGYVASHDDYLDLLRRAQLAVSTAHHEFFGLAMLEATHCGAFGLVPDALAYPEVFPAEHRYRDAHDLEERLEHLCTAWTRGELELRADRRHLTAPFDAARILPRLAERLGALCRR